MHFAKAFGLTWQSDFALEHFTSLESADAAATAGVVVRHVAQLAEREILRPIYRGAICADGFRFAWEDQAAFDVYDTFDGIGRVEVQPLPGWTGTLPWAFYSTVAALLLAGRGQVPFHACGIAVAGRAAMICGPSGAGKSTLTTGLVQHGAGFMADDLCAIDLHSGTPLMLPGRPAIRLFEPVAAIIGAHDLTPVSGDPRGKFAASFAAAQPEAALPLGLIVLLRDDAPPEPLALRFAELSRQLFRPKWLTRLPGHEAREQTMRALVSQLPMIALPPLGKVDAATFGPRCRAALQTITTALNAAATPAR